MFPPSHVVPISALRQHGQALIVETRIYSDLQTHFREKIFGAPFPTLTMPGKLIFALKSRMDHQDVQQ